MALKKGTKIFLALLGTFFVLIVVFYDFASDKALEKEIVCNYSVHDPEFVRVMNFVLGPSIQEGGTVETLLNGDEVFPAMLKAIAEAKKTITFESYIYWSGQIGRKFTDALSKKAREGLKVHVLLDWV